MEALLGLPWYFYCIGITSFLVTMAGVVVYMIIQSRMEKEEERQQEAMKSGQGLAAVQHPEPLHAWIKMACAPLDDGQSWAEKSIQEAQTMLRNDWSIMGGPLLEQCLMQLGSSPPSAWNEVRLLRVALAGWRAGYIDIAKMWAGVRPIAQRLQARHQGFDSIWNEYLVGYREWARLPPDGSLDDMKTQERRQKIEQWRARPPTVDYRAGL